MVFIREGMHYMLTESVSQDFLHESELPGLESQIFLAGQRLRYLLWQKEKSEQRKGLPFLLARIFSTPFLDMRQWRILKMLLGSQQHHPIKLSVY